MASMLKYFVFLMLCFTASCTSSGPANAKVLRTCFKAEPATIDPRKNSEVMGSRLQLMIYEGLTRLLPEGKIEWALAKSADISQDGLVYIFHLRDARWSDGKPITAHDFEYSWRKVVTPSFAAPSSILFSPIDQASQAIRGEVPPEALAVEALDEKTLRVRLAHPAPYFLSLVSFCPFFPIPQHIEREDPLWMHKNPDQLVTSGPYRLVRWARNEQLDLNKSSTYYDQRHVALDGIQISIIPDERTAVRMYENGELDWIDSIATPLALDDMEQLKRRSDWSTRPIGGTYFCAFNLDSPLFSNRTLRHAFSAALDRAALVEHASPLNEEAATRIVPPVICGGKNRDLITDANPLLAQELYQRALQELGLSKLEDHPDWKQVSLSYEAGDQARRIAQITQTAWKEVLGCEVPLAEMDYKTQLGSIESRTFSLTLDYWLVHFNDPTNVLERFKYKSSRKNYPGFENQTYVALLDQATQTSDASIRNQLLEQAEDLFADALPLTPLFHQSQAVLKSEKVEAAPLNPIGNPDYKSIRIRG